MNYYKLSKYNPEYFDEFGFYKPHEWTYLDQLGQDFDDGVFTWEQYAFVEGKYIKSISIILEHLDVESMSIFSPEKNVRPILADSPKLTNINMKDLPNFMHDKVVNFDDCLLFARLCLRDVMGFALTNKTNLFVAFTDDFYVTIGTTTKLETCKQKIEKIGLHLNNVKDEKVDKEYFKSILQSDLQRFMQVC